VLDPLLPFITPASIVWECASGKNKLVRRLTEAGHWVIHTDILTGTNFLTDDAPFIYDLVVTNPPFTLKNEFLQRCYSLDKPFALLMPINALDTCKRQCLYKQHGLEILMLPSQVTFHNTVGKAARFVCAWFCRGILPQQLKFT
jgi:hypothetical protein